MARVSRLARFTAVLIFISFLIVYQFLSKREYRKIIDLKEQLSHYNYDIRNDLNTENKGIKVAYEDLKSIDINYKRANATFVSLVRNDDLSKMSETIRSYEDRFNKKFHYPWIFINNEEFNEDFKRQIKNIVSGEVRFEKIPQEFWDYPDFIDPELAKKNRIKSRTKMMYGSSKNYRFMCRFFSGLFYKMDALQSYEYVWRVEPETKLHCDVKYDVFKFMKENDKQYGFTITLREFPETIVNLWSNVQAFIELFPQFLSPDNLLDFISDDKGENYNLCHFWTNFEIVNLDFYRSEAYTQFFNFLDHQKGFFYERWGDAPVHSIAASLFLHREQIHFFNDIGYFHDPMNNCPIDDDIWRDNNCLCDQRIDATFRDYSCTNKYYDVQKLKKPLHWEHHRGNGKHFE